MTKKSSPATSSAVHPDLLFFTSSNLATPNAMFCRQGGVSTPPFTGLNLSFSIGDTPAAVSQNREKVKKHLNIQHLASAVQVHGKGVAIVEDVTCDQEYEKIDALITQQKGVGLLIQQADCQAVLLHDPKQNAIGALHSGWRGSVANIIRATVRTMQKNFDTSPEDLRAVISPALGPCCAEFINYKKELPQPFHRWQVKENHFDFWSISQWQLQEAGVPSNHIEIMGNCTMCNEKFFSYRRATKNPNHPGITGRNGSVIALSQQ